MWMWDIYVDFVVLYINIVVIIRTVYNTYWMWMGDRWWGLLEGRMLDLPMLLDTAFGHSEMKSPTGSWPSAI